MMRDLMCYRLRAQEAPADGIRRIAREELDLAIRTLRSRARESVRIHRARKHLKRLRALLRLVRERTGRDFFRAHNHRLRDLGRRLAPLRDAEVARLTLAHMRRGTLTVQARRAVAHLRQQVGSELPGENRAGVLRGVAAELRRLHGAVERWPLADLEWRELSRTLVRTHRRARIEREHFRLRRDLPSLHEWRKRSKDLWYQLLLLHPLARPDARRLTRQLDRLTDTQGLMHDVQLVIDATHRHGRELSVWERQALLELNGDPLTEFTRLALEQGRQVFRGTPKSFAAALRAQPR